LSPIPIGDRGHTAKEIRRNLLNEKEAIEKGTAGAFIELYNIKMGTSFSIFEYSDAPDIRCKDKEGNTFNLEITLTEDKPKDIQAALGRSDHRSLEALKKHLSDEKANPMEWVSCLQGDVTEMIVSRINPKLENDYGANVALVVRDSSPLDWDWEFVVDQIKSKLNLVRNPFDKGIWVISNSKDRIIQLV
jgi:hypothetical protein